MQVQVERNEGDWVKETQVYVLSQGCTHSLGGGGQGIHLYFIDEETEGQQFR